MKNINQTETTEYMVATLSSDEAKFNAYTN